MTSKGKFLYLKISVSHFPPEELAPSATSPTKLQVLCLPGEGFDAIWAPR